jgi:hypothetical protein
MKVELLRLGAANKPSPISEGITEIWINSQLCKGINLTIRHTQARKASRVATIHDTVKEPAENYLALVLYFTRTPQRTHRGWPDTIPYNIHKEVGYRPTQQHMKLLSLGIPYVPYASVHFKCLFIQTQLTRALIDTGWGYTLELWISDQTTHPPSHPVLSIFP